MRDENLTLMFYFRQIDIKNRVEEYLNKTFHNHTALALHNWKVGVKIINCCASDYIFFTVGSERLTPCSLAVVRGNAQSRHRKVFSTMCRNRVAESNAGTGFGRT